MPARSAARVRPVDADARHLPRQRLERVGGQGLLVGSHARHADGLEVVDGGTEPDGGGDVGRAGFELVGDVVEGGVPQVHGVDHLATAQERRHLLQQLGSCPQRTGAGGTQHLVAAEDVEVGTDVLHVHGQVRHGLCAIDQHQRPHLVRLRHHLLHGGDGAQGVGLVGEGHQPGPRSQQHLPRVHVQAPFNVEGHELEVGVPLLRQQLPGDQVGVVLQLGQHDRVRAADVAAAPGVGHQVDGLGGVADEDDLAPIGGVDEAGDLVPRALVGRRGLLAEGVDAAMHVGAVATVVAVHGLGHLAWLERGGGTVEVGQPPSMELALEEREVAADDLGVEERGGIHAIVSVAGRLASTAD